MSKDDKIKKKKKKKRNYDDNSGCIVIGVFVGLVIIIYCIWAYFVLYNPKKHDFYKKSTIAYIKIEKELFEIFEKQNYLFKEDNSDNNLFCIELSKRLSLKKGYCPVLKSMYPEKNFTIKKTNIEILGLEKPVFKVNGVAVKDIIIDVDGEKKGENIIGIDRIPVRMYSTGRLGGMLSPINCKAQDQKDYDFIMSQFCNGSESVNYLETNEPFGFDIKQIGGDNGRTRKISSNIPFLRADCAAFGGDMLDLDEYCEDKKYYWLKACYEEFPCSVSISTNF